MLATNSTTVVKCIFIIISFLAVVPLGGFGSSCGGSSSAVAAAFPTLSLQHRIHQLKQRNRFVGLLLSKIPSSNENAVVSKWNHDSNEKYNNNNNNNNKQSLLLIEEFESDLDRLTRIRPPVPTEDISAPHTLISAGSSYTRLWSFKTWQAHTNKSPHQRYVRHILKWHMSTTARKIMPTVLLASSWGALLAIIVQKFSTSRIAKLLLQANWSNKALGILAAPLALLLTLRANASLSRLNEARLLWGRLVLHTRSLASIIKVYLYPYCPSQSILIARYLACLGWVLKASVRGEAIEKSEYDVLRTMLRKKRGYGNEYKWLVSQPKRTIGIITRTRQLIASATRELPASESQMISSIHLLLEQKLADIELSLGGCERLFTSPIPPTYSRHLSRIMFLWILLLPLSLVSNSGFGTVGSTVGGGGVGMLLYSTWGVVTATAVGTYVLVGLDEVGMEIENAFQLLPLQQLAAAVQNGVRSQFLTEMPNISTE